ncbi:MAG: T9SS type A sorting domain-containing protein [Salinivirgaceae bacterium]
MKTIFFCLGILTALPLYSQVFTEFAKTLPIADSSATWSELGSSIAIDGDYAVIGMPEVSPRKGKLLIYYKNNQSWEPIAELSNSFGYYSLGLVVSISGNTIVAGCKYAGTEEFPSSGVAFVYVKPEGGWKDMTETATLTSSNKYDMNYFGSSVDIEGNTIVIGAFLNSIDYKRTGASYIFEKPTNGWTDMTETAMLTASDKKNNDYFGCSVHISNNLVIVGAEKATGIINNSGSAYLYQKPNSGWIDMTETAKLYANDGISGDGFGGAVCVSGNIVAIGAKYEDSISTNSGSVYVFEKPENGWGNMAETKKIVASDAGYNSSFGYSLSIIGDTIFVGSPDHKYRGAVYVFAKPDSGWSYLTETAKIIEFNSKYDNKFGTSIAISGDYLLSGAPCNVDKGDRSGAVFVFQSTENGWKENYLLQKLLPPTYQNTTGFYYGESVSIYKDYAVVGAENYMNSKGIAYVLHFNNNTWENIAILQASDGEMNEYFGSSVYINDGVIAIGAYWHNGGAFHGGAVYVYEKPAGGWTNMTETVKVLPNDISGFDRFGESLCISGNTLVVGGLLSKVNNQETGAVYVFEKPASGWVDITQKAKLYASDGENGDYFGIDIGLSGSTIIVGAYYDNTDFERTGSAYIFEKPVSGWTNRTETAKLLVSNRKQYEYFGSSVDIYENTAVVGSQYGNGFNVKSGLVYVFEKPANGWSNINETAILSSSDAENEDRFGCSVSIYNSTIIASAYSDDDRGYDMGAVYVFEKADSTWLNSNESYKLTVSGSGHYNNFGYDIDLYENVFVSGAYQYDNELGQNGGAAYFFKKSDIFSITQHPVDINNACLNSIVNFSIQGNNILNYQWQLSINNGLTFINIVEAGDYQYPNNRTLQVNVDSTMNSNMYRCIVSNQNNIDTSDVAILHLDNSAPVITSVHSDTTIIFNSDNLILPDFTGDVEAYNYCDSRLSITQIPEAGSVIQDDVTNVTITVTDNKGIATSISFRVFYEIVGYVENESEFISIHPNPVNDLLNVSFNEKEIDFIKLYNSSGTMIYADFKVEDNTSIDMRNFSTGIYYVTISIDKKRYMHKIICQ